MKIGITGASGFMGVNILKLLKGNKDYSLKLLLREEPTYMQEFKYGKVMGVLADKAALQEFCTDVDVIIHLAAAISIESKNNDLVMETNVIGTKNLVEAAKEAGVGRFIHFSSIHALEHQPLDIPMDENRPLALKSILEYERTKALGEEFVMNNNSETFETIILNPTAIIGPNDYKPSLIGLMVQRIVLGKLPALVPGGYDWTDVRDIAKTAIRAITQGKPGHRYILSGTWLPISELAILIGKTAGTKNKIPVIPIWIANMGVPFIKLYAAITGTQALYTYESLKILQEGNRNILSNKARADLGYAPRELEETIKDTVAWFKGDNNRISSSKTAL